MPNLWKNIPNICSNRQMADALVELLIEKGLLTPLEHFLGHEGCWIGVFQ